jgi:hypothetical protein
MESWVMSTTVMRASAFIDTLGVNTHIPYTDGGYANIPNVISDIKYLGVDQVRDAISNGSGGSAPLSSYITVAKAGVHFTFCLNSSTTAGLQAEVALVDQVNEAVPGSVTAVEGPNEINNFPVTYNGVSGLQGALNMQTALYSMVHSDPNLKGVAVDYFTGYNAGGIGVGPNPATTPGLADYDTQHPYPNNGDAPEQWVNRTQALGNETPATGPAVYTETGYSTNGGTTGDVNQDVQAKYTLDLLMDDAQSGIAHTDLYQLMDAYKPGSPQGDDGYGLFDPNNNAKEAATAIHNLTTILADTGTNAATFTTKPVDYSLSGLPSTGNSMELQKSDGATDIVVWNEPQIWDEAKGTEITAPTDTVSVNLGGTYQTVEVYDPLSSSSPVETLSNVSSVSLGLTDHPLIVQVGSGTTTTTSGSGTTTTSGSGTTTTSGSGTTSTSGSGTTSTSGDGSTGTSGDGNDTIALNVSGDDWQGDPEFTVKVNGKQVGGDYSASALHSSGDAGTVSLSGDWGSGVNDVAVSFINDAYGGSSSEDRNLYINSISENGTTYANTSGALYNNGTDTFAVGGTTPTETGPADTLTLNLSEDAYQGNAEFVLYVDGKAVTTPQVVTALHDANATQGFTFTGNWGAGNHTIGIGYVNDAYGGSASADRNLYIDGVTLNGSSVFSGVKELYSDGTENYAVTTKA